MEKQDYKKRFLYPVAVIFLIMSASWIIYNAVWRLDSRVVHQFLAAISGTLLFLSVTLGPLFIYPTAYFRGASLRERVSASLVNPFLWATKEVVRLFVSYSFAESLYYYLNPLAIALFFGVVAQMGLAELVCRWRQARNGEEVRVFSTGALGATGVGLVVVIFLFVWGQGENAYVIFLSGYREIFGSGL